MTTPMKIAKLQELATEMVGDDRKPDLYFVTVKGVVITVTRNLELAYGEWKQLANVTIESALENRQFGVLCSVEPDDENDNKLIIHDDTNLFHRRD